MATRTRYDPPSEKVDVKQPKGMARRPPLGKVTWDDVESAVLLIRAGAKVRPPAIGRHAPLDGQLNERRRCPKACSSWAIRTPAAPRRLRRADRWRSRRAIRIVEQLIAKGPM